MQLNKSSLCVYIYLSSIQWSLWGPWGPWGPSDHKELDTTEWLSLSFNTLYYALSFTLFFFFLQGSLREVISKLVSRMVILPLVTLLPPFFGLVYLLVGHPCYLVTKLCPSLYYPMDCSLPDSSVRGISQARILEWVAISSSRGSSPPRDPTYVSVSCIGRQVLYH